MRENPGMLRRLLLLFVAGAALVIAPAAFAGTYDVYSCYAGADSFRNPRANARAWAKASETNWFCSGFDQWGSTDCVFGVNSLTGYQPPNGTWGEVSFSAPSGTRIERVRFW